MIKSAFRKDTNEFGKFGVKIVLVIGWVNDEENSFSFLIGLKISENLREVFCHDKAISL
jgi:hypothetical protein